MKDISTLIKENKSRKTHKTVRIGVGTGNGLKERRNKNGHNRS